MHFDLSFYLDDLQCEHVKIKQYRSYNNTLLIIKTKSGLENCLVRVHKRSNDTNEENRNTITFNR